MILQKIIANSPRVNQISHRVDSLISTPQNWQSSSITFILRALMALDHRRLIRPGKTIQAEFFAFLQNLANKSGCV